MSHNNSSIHFFYWLISFHHCSGEGAGDWCVNHRMDLLDLQLTSELSGFVLERMRYIRNMKQYDAVNGRLNGPLFCTRLLGFPQEIAVFTRHNREQHFEKSAQKEALITRAPRT